MREKHKRLTSKAALAWMVPMVALPTVVSAQQHDAPYYDYQKRNVAKWAAEDEQIDQKLEALRNRFGKRPNIIYILADDVGWGELGCYLGGKLTGRPSETLDHMADHGIAGPLSP